ncbi:hypothetical protein SAMN04488058_12039 [Deinococcus reticulitermitis]|uniref:DUF4357 domain-containing protein n=1 Tax=Deinococcus reticulitermitis TaxID=856736 RepID=A0A1H7BZD0_9DEIO|nr:DUF4357 domain-containing protein [Deinococcus reticulitermitis]SEJ81707.1 hypothetical protein SAMN04488058_12039 [Deinococcus reticulitermitis]
MPFSEVQGAVQAIQRWLDEPPGEAFVRQCIVLRLLQAAGFDIWNPDEVHPEETNVTGNRADFLIRRGRGRFALELKGMGTSLQARDYQQALNYAVSVGTRWAIVTNGRVWLVLDERRDGDWEAKIALRVEMGQEGDTFASDLAALLDPAVWERDHFAQAVEGVQQRQQQRKDEARIRRDKKPIVEEIRQFYGISTFELAADAASKMGRITEAERDVLLGKGASAPQPDPPEAITFSYAPAGARATALFFPSLSLWIVKAGSTARREVKAYAAAIGRRREKLLQAGILVDDGRVLTYQRDVEYRTPSAAAGDVAGGSKNGWDVWHDTLGRPAQHHRSE